MSSDSTNESPESVTKTGHQGDAQEGGKCYETNQGTGVAAAGTGAHSSPGRAPPVRVTVRSPDDTEGWQSVGAWTPDVAGGGAERTRSPEPRKRERKARNVREDFCEKSQPFPLNPSGDHGGDRGEQCGRPCTAPRRTGPLMWPCAPRAERAKPPVSLPGAGR